MWDSHWDALFAKDKKGLLLKRLSECVDGEMDEPESMAGLLLAGREKLDNLVFVVNCNLQRLDGLVRSNGKIVHELEGQFRAAGWQVLKVMN